MRRAAASLLILSLAACGRMGDLEPVEGTSLPPAPYGASEPLSAAELLVSDPVAVPERSVELRSESEEREDDPFDLPPEG
jgi:predicted small lipoprotein YifL